MVAVIDTFVANVVPYFAVALDVIIQFLQLIGIIALLGYAVVIYRYDTKINVREYSKGGRIITFTTRAIKIKDKKTGAPKLKFFGFLGFGGDVINEPPAECLIAHRSRLTHKMYDLIKKDGLYYPVQNIVLGIKHKVEDEKTGEIKEVYSIEGSGLEISRDYDAEQAIQNTMIEKATSYRNKKPTEVIASFVLMIITIIVSGVVMWFAWKQFGNMAGAIASLREPLREGITAAAQNIIGPG